MICTMGRKKKGYKAPEGLILQAGSPNWYIKWKHVYKSTGTSDLERARLIFIEIQKMVLTEELRAREMLGKSVPFSQLIQRYLKEISPEKISGKSDHVNSKHPLKYFGDRRVDTIEPRDIYKYFEWRKEQISLRKKRPVSGATMNREKSLISDAFKNAIKWGYVQTNPVAEVEGFKEKKRDRYITDGEFEAIEKAARLVPEAAHLPNIMDALYYTVQRSGKIFSLKWSQVNLEQRKITLDGGSKTKGVPHEVWVSQPLFELFSRLKAERHFQKVVGPYVFQKRDGRPYRSVKKAWNNCCKKAGALNARIHDIRHKAITDMGKKGYSLQEIAKAAGHSQISTTMRYTHLRAEDTREALESLARKNT